MKTKLNELLEFPCSFTYKIMGVNSSELIDHVLIVVQKYIPGDYNPIIKPSSKNNYQSISITVYATEITQIENLYEDLGKIKGVKLVL
jgi:uncharacterized protein